MNFKKNRAEELELNLTPLIDVVFLLLIFFMVTTTFDRETQLKIELPQASGELKKAKKMLDVSIDAKGRFFVNEAEVINTDIETIKKALSQAAEGNEKPPILINADGNASHQSVVKVLDAASQLGFVNITFAASQPSAEKK